MITNKIRTIVVASSTILTVIVVNILNGLFNLSESGLMVPFNTIIAVCFTLSVYELFSRREREKDN